ncbi:MAG: DUF1499 domain-containing protein [Planctomycetota bacterium]
MLNKIPLPLLILSPPLVALTVGVGASIASQAPVEVGLVGGQLRPCPSPARCVNSNADEGATVPPFPYLGDPDESFQALVALVADDPNAELITVERDYAHAVYRTPVLRFADDLELKLEREQDAIHVRSSSRVGYSDLGMNHRRVEDLRARWKGGAGRGTSVAVRSPE